jgi:hypothetical protein
MNFNKAFKEYEKKLRGRYMNVIIANHWLRRRRKFGPELDDVIRCNIRKHITFVALVEHEPAR